jgi:hypothetical protein
MAWGEINGLLLVSGGLGMFDKEKSLRRAGTGINRLVNMELITRMRKLMHQKKGKVLDYTFQNLFVGLKFHQV